MEVHPFFLGNSLSNTPYSWWLFSSSKFDKDIFHLVSALICWNLWLARNKFLADGVLPASSTTSHLIMAATSLEVEAYGLMHALKMAINCGYLAMEIKMDSLLLFNMVQGDTSIAWKIDWMIRQIKQYLSQGQFYLSHNFRKANGSAYALAKLGSSLTNVDAISSP
ncbi:hypothetical protein ACH5RR_018253 [Cinchona calisaya]|uniref:RNase H type-1 domain-containing protein n=1 Tax=Cinchona calisaya TaxID=153742 RepID=A0ABD2ZLH4_9GENT